jgi:hypothetical protein
MMAKETVTWTDANGVTHTRKVKKANMLLHGLAFMATGGMSAPVSAAKVAANAAHNEGTRQRIAKDMRPRLPLKLSQRTRDPLKLSQRTRDKARVEPGKCKLCDRPDCDGIRHLPH